MSGNYPLVEELESSQPSTEPEEIFDDEFRFSASFLKFIHGPVYSDEEYVHQIFRRRYKQGVHHLSRCQDLFLPETKFPSFFRVDSMKYQRRLPYHHSQSPIPASQIINKLLRKIKMGTLCKDIRKRFEIYGYVGRGK